MSTLKTIINILMITGLVLSCERDVSDRAEQHDQIPFSKIELSAGQKKVAGIQTGELKTREMSQYVAANGYFDVPPQNKAQISTFKAGYVKSTRLLVGDKVKKGQVVTVLENPDYVKIQQEYMETKGQLEYLKLEYERKKVLEQEKITAQRNLQKAEADYQGALARSQGLKKELQLMGIGLRHLEAGNYTTTMNIRAPIDGTVTKVSTTMGKYVLPQEVLLELVNTDHLHVELEVYEKDVVKIKEGQKIRLYIPNLSKQRYQGEVYLVGKALDPQTRTIHVHGHIPEEPTFVPGMYVQADIEIESKTVPALPEEAVWSEGQDQFIFLELPSTGTSFSYKKMPVETGISSDGWIEVKPLETLPERPRVVYSGGYYLNSASAGN